MQLTITLAPFEPASVLFPEVARLFQSIWPDRFFSRHDAMARIRQHARYTGFRGVAALSSSGQAIGFVYGYTNQRGQWWFDQILRQLPLEQDGSALAGSFAFTELAVAPEWRQQGIGKQLHDAILSGLPHQYAILSTQADNAPARALYERCGWSMIIPGMLFDGIGPAFVILGRSLPL